MSRDWENQDEQNASAEAQQVVLKAKVMAAALMIGVCLFAGIAVFVSVINIKGMKFGNLAVDELVMLCVGGGFAALAILLVMSGISPAMFGQPQPDDFAQAWLGKMIFRMALCEGAALLNLLFVMITSNALFFIIVGLLLFIMLLLFPSRTKLEHYIENRQALMRDQ